METGKGSAAVERIGDRALTSWAGKGRVLTRVDAPRGASAGWVCGEKGGERARRKRAKEGAGRVPRSPSPPTPSEENLKLTRKM